MGLNTDDRISALESRLTQLEDTINANFRFTKTIDGDVHIMTMGPLGIETDYQGRLERGKRSNLSVGGMFCRNTLYLEPEAASDKDNPTAAIFIWNKNPNATQPNIGIDIHVDGSLQGNIPLRLDGVGIVLEDNVNAFYIGKSVKDAKRIWP